MNPFPVRRLIRTFLSAAGKNILFLLIAILVSLYTLPLLASSSYVGRTEGEMRVTPLGQTEYEISIPALPGTGGMTPHLSITYNSSSKSGLLGHGFDLKGLSIIGRAPQNLALDGKAGEVTFTADDRFALDGTRLVLDHRVNSSERVYYTEQNCFARVTATGPEGDPTQFTVQTKDGITYEYAANTRILQPSSTEPGLFWMLTRATDTSGNYFTVTYGGDNHCNEIYPTRIDYTGNANAGLQPYASVRLTYEDRPDTAYTYLHGHIVRHLKCVSTIGLFYGNSKVREYRMGYTMSNSHKLLASITEAVPGVTEKNPTLFHWSNSGMLTVSRQGKQTVHYLSHVKLHVGDFNGDGKDDFVAMPEDDDAPYNGWRLYISQGNGFYNAANGTLVDGNIPSQVVVADFDGDGRADLATVSRLADNQDKISVYRSTGSGFLAPVHVQSYSSGFEIHPIEANGDGFAELMVTFPDGSYHLYRYSEFFPGEFGMSYTASGTCSQAWGTVICADFNGDGLTDIVNMRGSDSRMMTANGQCGFTEASFGFGTNDAIYIGDFNADGKDDILYSAHNNVPITSGWPLRASNGNGAFLHICYVQQPFMPTEVKTYVADVNGDGYADLITINETGTGHPCVYLNDCMGGFLAQIAGNSLYDSDKSRYYPGDFNGDGKAEFVITADYENATWKGYDLLLFPDGTNMLLDSITDGLGNTTEITYKYMSDAAVHTRGSTYTPKVNSFSSSWPVVWKVRTPDGIGGRRVLTYNYKNALMHRMGRGVLGFSEVTATDSVTNIVTTTQFSPCAFRYVMDPVHTETRKGNRLLSETDTRYDNLAYGSGPFMHLPDSVFEKTYEYSSGQLLTDKRTVNHYDHYGNLTCMVVTDGDITVTTNNTFTNDTTAWRLGRLTVTTVDKEGASGTVSHRASFEYDGVTGFLKTETSEPYNTTLGYRKTYVHDVFGNITSSTTTPLNTTFASRTDSTTYDARGRFIKTCVNSLGHTTTNQVDDYDGLLTWSKDANGIYTYYNYDSFGRNTRSSTPTGTTNATVAWSTGHADAPATALYYTRTETTGQPYSLVFSDCHGRAVRTVTENAFGQKVYTDVIYNAKGQVWKTSEPYFPGSTPAWTVNTYDDVGRLHTQTDAAGGTTTYAYQGHTTTVTDALGHRTVKETDCHGNLIRSTDHEGGTVEYEYDIEGHCTQITGPRTTVNMEYDLRGNRTRLDDPDLGVTTSVYNAYGELTSQTDDKGTTTYAYDRLGRVTTETRPDVTIFTVYDTRFKGAVSCDSASNGTATQYYYDSYGRSIRQRQRIDYSYYETKTSYDQQGHTDTLTYPNGFKVKYFYATNGLLLGVKDAATQNVIWRQDAQNARGQTVTETYGNGRTTSTAYDIVGRTTAIVTPSIQNWTYTYDAVGNLTSRCDQSRSMTEGFTYDNLGRLVTVKKNGVVTQQSTYDAAGNLLSRTGVGHGFTYANGTNRLEGFYASNPYTNMWDDIRYTSFHKISHIGYGQNTLDITYGPDKSRVKAVQQINDSIETRRYVGNLYELHASSDGITKICYIYAQGKTVAIHETKGNTTQILYLHHDHLGSVQAYSDATGNLVQELSYDAWGRRRDPATWECYALATGAQARNPWGFTGHEHIDLFGLVNMDGRMYDPFTGRFLSPDPYVQAPDFTQGLNRYTYCLNNPLSLTDPTGYSWLSSNWKSLVGAAVGIVVSVVTMGSGSGVGIAIIAGAAGGAAGALTTSLLNGANIGQIAKATVTGAFWGGVSGAVNWASADPDLFAKIFKHTFSQGFLEGVQGGNALHGMMMGAVSCVGGEGITALSSQSKALNITMSAVLGGTVSELGGGKFANGAITSAYSYMFNDMMHELQTKMQIRKIKKEFPGFEELWKNYPKNVNGKIVHPSNDSYAKNQCAIRLGLALQKSGVDMSNYTDPVTSEGYPRGAQSLANWIVSNFGSPQITKNRDVFLKLNSGKTGIFFQKALGPGRSNHIDLWNKEKAGSSIYVSGEIWFWEIK